MKSTSIRQKISILMAATSVILIVAILTVSYIVSKSKHDKAGSCGNLHVP